MSDFLGCVLIVPLWNWNVERDLSVCDLSEVLIVPLWNWNFIIHRNIHAFFGFNCTFMELKWRSSKRSYRCNTVLIVPLWNWNSAHRADGALQKGFNCTFMELKWTRAASWTLPTPRFNCTFMELKWRWCRFC